MQDGDHRTSTQILVRIERRAWGIAWRELVVFMAMCVPRAAGVYATKGCMLLYSTFLYVPMIFLMGDCAAQLDLFIRYLAYTIREFGYGVCDSVPQMNVT